MALLISPATYLSVADFKAMPNDYDLTPYTDSQLTTLLVHASARANSILRRDLRAREETIRYYGNDTNRIDLLQRPILYVKRVQVVVPGTNGLSIPLQQMLIDYQDGEAFEYTPLIWMGMGLTTIFPSNAPVDVTLAHGYGYSVVKAPVWTWADVNGGTLSPGRYNVAIVPKSMYGELPTTIQQLTVNNGAAQIAVTPVLGAYLYRVYASDATHNTTLIADAAAGATMFAVASTSGMAANQQWLVDSEIVTIATVGVNSVTLQSATASAHDSAAVLMPVPTVCAETPFTSFGNSPLGVTLTSLAAPYGIWPDAFPTSDTTAPQQPEELTEATRLLALSALLEQNNPANRGIYQIDSGKKRLAFRSTEGNSGRGKPTLVEQAEDMLMPLSLQAIY